MDLVGGKVILLHVNNNGASSQEYKIIFDLYELLIQESAYVP